MFEGQVKQLDTKWKRAIKKLKHQTVEDETIKIKKDLFS